MRTFLIGFLLVLSIIVSFFATFFGVFLLRVFTAPLHAWRQGKLAAHLVVCDNCRNKLKAVRKARREQEG